MSLQLIFGRSGTGKSTYCYQDIKKIINNKEKIYIITPEQFSFTAEKNLLDAVGTESVVNAEVLNFNRIANRVFTEVGGITKTHLSKCGRTMLVYDCLNKEKKNFKFLRAAEKNIDVALNSITELKTHNILNLQNIINQTEDIYLKTKLEDLNLIYQTFQNTIKDRYIDENDLLTLLLEKLKQSKMFENTIVYIDEFVGFTAQEYEIIKEILKIADRVNICITADVDKNTNLDEVNKEEIFYETKKTASKLIKATREVNIPIEKSIFLTETYRFKTSELKHLEKNIFKNIYNQYPESIKNIQIFLALNLYSEIENVAKNIIKLIREEKYTYNDISIIAKNINMYSSIIKVVFSKYEIPVFIDEKKGLNQNVLVKYILSILDVIYKNFSYESVFNYLKNPLSGFEAETIYTLEKYCLKWGIKGKKWFSKWEFEDINTKELELIRELIVTPIVSLKESIDNEKKFEDITKALYEFLVKNNIEENINKRIIELEEMGFLDLANEYRSSIKVVLEVFDEIVMIFKNQKTTFEKYREILKIGLDNINIGKIPASLENVIVGDVERSKTHKVKAIFLIGLNDGVFPSNAKDEGFLNDEDRETLKANGVELANGTLEQLYAEQFSIYKAFTIAEEKLFLSYASSDKDGKALRPSMLIAKIKKIFKNIQTESDIINKKSEITVEKTTFDELLLNLRKFNNGEKIDEIWFAVYCWYLDNKEWTSILKDALKGLKYSNVAEKLNEENIKKLYGETLKTSVSRLEQYKKCPFSFYLKYGLKVEEELELELKPIDTGSFMHEVIDEFFEQVKDIYLKNLEKDKIQELVYKIIEEKLKLPKNYKFSSNIKFITLTNRLKKVILKSIEYILYQLKYSDFKIMGNELEFKEGKDYPPIILELENKQKIEITGKIDRVDLAISGDKKFIRIIDYKSSIKNIDLNEVVSGLQIQLLTYLDSITKIEDILPAGVMYFNLIDPIVKNNRNLTDEEIEQEIKKQFRMQGLILADINIVKMMDNKLETGASDIINVQIKKDGTLSGKVGNLIKAEDFKNLQKEVRKIVKQISIEILKGNIEIKPYKKDKKTTCEYCQYKTICGFNTNIKGNEYLKVKQKTKQEILEEIKK